MMCRRCQIRGCRVSPAETRPMENADWPAHWLGVITRIRRVSALITNPSFLSQWVAPLHPHTKILEPPQFLPGPCLPQCSHFQVLSMSLLKQCPVLCPNRHSPASGPCFPPGSLHHPAWPSASPLPSVHYLHCYKVLFPQTNLATLILGLKSSGNSCDSLGHPLSVAGRTFRICPASCALLRKLQLSHQNCLCEPLHVLLTPPETHSPLLITSLSASLTPLHSHAPYPNSRLLGWCRASSFVFLLCAPHSLHGSYCLEVTSDPFASHTLSPRSVLTHFGFHRSQHPARQT